MFVLKSREDQNKTGKGKPNIGSFLVIRLHSLCILQGGAEDFRGGSQIFRAKKGGI